MLSEIYIPKDSTTNFNKKVKSWKLCYKNLLHNINVKIHENVFENKNLSSKIDSVKDWIATPQYDTYDIL